MRGAAGDAAFIGYLLGDFASVLLALSAIIVGVIAIAQLQGRLWKRVVNVGVSVVAILAGVLMFTISTTTLVTMSIVLIIRWLGVKP